MYSFTAMPNKNTNNNTMRMPMPVFHQENMISEYIDNPSTYSLRLIRAGTPTSPA
jgi:hypothetical protein